jgi:hypothetical protein
VGVLALTYFIRFFIFYLSLSFTIIRSEKLYNLLIYSVHYNVQVFVYYVDISMTSEISKIYVLNTCICLNSNSVNAHDCILTCTSVYGILF